MKHSHSALFLMELIISILFFSLASTVCIQLFAKAHLLSEKSANENNAVIKSQNLAESFLATNGNLSQMAEIFSGSANDDTLELFYNKDWDICSENDAYFKAVLTVSLEENGLNKADICIETLEKNNTENIYSLSVLQHIPERRGNIEIPNET